MAMEDNTFTTKNKQDFIHLFLLDSFVPAKVVHQKRIDIVLCRMSITLMHRHGDDIGGYGAQKNANA